ncbi:uncharacterized protein LOC135482508 [Lineus longissimus]|uniref:uncharacterized protein LOC135482508 n=1 Tax=Lineus longissimus TaxID=88925 RepID=UPI002B4FA110
MSVATRPFSQADSSPWCQSPNSSFVFRDKEYRSATTALDEYINKFDQDKSWNSPSGVGSVEESFGGRADDVYDRMLKAIKSGSPDGKESSAKVAEMTIANVSRLPSTPSRPKDDDAETTITDLLTDCPGSRSISRGSPVGHSSSGGSSDKKSHSPDRSITPSTTASHRSGSRPKARRSLNSPLNRSPSPFSKLHPDVPVPVARDPCSPLNKLNLPSSPLKQAEDYTNTEILTSRPEPSWVEDLAKDISSVRDGDAKDTLPSKIPTWVDDLDASAAAEKLNSFLNSTDSTIIGSEGLKNLPTWLQDMDTSDVSAVLNLIDKQLKDRAMSDTLSTISGSFVSDDGASVRKAGFDKRTGIPGRKIYWDANDSITNPKNKLLTLNEKDKIRQRLVKFDDHNSYRLKRRLENSLPHRISSASLSDESLLGKSGRTDVSTPRSRDSVPRSKSVDRLSFASARSVSDISSDTDYLVTIKPPVGRNRASPSPSLNRLSQFDSSNRLASPKTHLGSRTLRTSSVEPRRERMSEFRLSKLLSPAVPRKPLERTRSMSAYDEFKLTASRAGRTSSPVKYKSMFLDDTSLHTSRKSPRSERAEKMIRDAIATPLLRPSPFNSNTTASTESLLNAKVTTPDFSSFNSSFTTTEKVNLLDHKQYISEPYISSNSPGSMEALKNILFTMQNVASTADIVDGTQTENVDKATRIIAKAFNRRDQTEPTEEFENEVGGQVLQKAFMHLSKLKSLVAEDIPVTEDMKSSG